MNAVKEKIQHLLQKLDEAEERELAVRREFDTERELRDKVRKPCVFSVNFCIFHADIPVEECAFGL